MVEELAVLLASGFGAGVVARLAGWLIGQVGAIWTAFVRGL